MRCTLHIGTEKTGTTTLQRLLRDNRDALYERGVYVPRAFGPLEHHHLVSYGLRPGRFFSPLAREGANTPEEIKALRAKVRADFKKELRPLQPDTNIVLSSERCFSVLQRPREVERVVAMLSKFCDDIKVVVYLRPQHDLCASLYSTKLKNGFVDNDILPTDVSNMPHLDYHATLETWASVVGHDNIDVRVFDRDELLNGDIGADFFANVLNLNVGDFESVSNENESLNVEGQLFLLALNEHLPRFDGDRLNKKRGNIPKHISGAASGKGMLPTQDTAQQFYAQFADSNEKVREQWFPDRPSLFNASFSKYPESAAAYELSQDEAFRIFASMWESKHQEAEELKADKARQRRQIKRLRKQSKQ